MQITFRLRVLHTQGIESAWAQIDMPALPLPLRPGEAVQLPVKDDWLKLYISKVTHIVVPERYRIEYECDTWRCETETRYQEAIEVLQSVGFTVKTTPAEGDPDVPPQP